jgi:hypothetical protein
MVKTGFLLCATICTVALLAAIGASAPTDVRAATGTDPSGSGLPEDFFEIPVSATSVRFCFAGPDEGSAYDSWTIRIARGTTPPPADAPPTATFPQEPSGACYTATGLVTDEAYTFRLTGHNASGEGPPAFHTFAARRPGTFVLNGGSREKLPWDTDFMQLAVTMKDRRWHAIFPFGQRDENGTLLEWTFYSTRRRSGWTKPKLAAGSLNSVLAANASSLALTWSDEMRRYRPRYRLKASHASTFGAQRTVPHARRRDSVFASALDRRGHLHLLTYGRRTDGGAVYSSNGSGRWREQVIPGAWGCNQATFFLPQACPEPPLLTYDSVSDRVVVVSQGRGRVRIASKRASARRFGALHPVTAANKRHLTATSLASRAGHTTLGLASKPAGLVSEPKGPFYVLADGQLVRVPGTTANDENLLVAASAANRVQLAWQRLSPTWSRHQQGVWTAESMRDPRTGRWSIRNLRHRSDSHYDVLNSLTSTAAGRGLLSYRRVGGL